MKPLFTFFTFILLTSIIGCADKTPMSSSGNMDGTTLPNTPEEVARTWQAAIDSNQFEIARLLSTPATNAVIDMIAAFADASEADSSIIHTVFEKMECTTLDSSAVCRYVINEYGEEIVDSFILVRSNGQWLVDVPQDNGTIMDPEDLEGMFEVDEDKVFQ